MKLRAQTPKSPHKAPVLAEPYSLAHVATPSHAFRERSSLPPPLEDPGITTRAGNVWASRDEGPRRVRTTLSRAPRAGAVRSHSASSGAARRPGQLRAASAEVLQRRRRDAPTPSAKFTAPSAYESALASFQRQLLAFTHQESQRVAKIKQAKEALLQKQRLHSHYTHLSRFNVGDASPAGGTARAVSRQKWLTPMQATQMAQKELQDTAREEASLELKRPPGRTARRAGRNTVSAPRAPSTLSVSTEAPMENARKSRTRDAERRAGSPRRGMVTGVRRPSQLLLQRSSSSATSVLSAIVCTSTDELSDEEGEAHCYMAGPRNCHFLEPREERCRCAAPSSSTRNAGAAGRCAELHWEGSDGRYQSKPCQRCGPDARLPRRVGGLSSCSTVFSAHDMAPPSPPSQSPILPWGKLRKPRPLSPRSTMSDTGSDSTAFEGHPHPLTQRSSPHHQTSGSGSPTRQVTTGTPTVTGFVFVRPMAAARPLALSSRHRTSREARAPTRPPRLKLGAHVSCAWEPRLHSDVGVSSPSNPAPAGSIGDLRFHTLIPTCWLDDFLRRSLARTTLHEMIRRADNLRAVRWRSEVLRRMALRSMIAASSRLRDVKEADRHYCASLRRQAFRCIRQRLAVLRLKAERRRRLRESVGVGLALHRPVSHPIWFH